MDHASPIGIVLDAAIPPIVFLLTGLCFVLIAPFHTEDWRRKELLGGAVAMVVMAAISSPFVIIAGIWSLYKLTNEVDEHNE